MRDLLGLIAFAGLIAAQFLAVVFVRHDAQAYRDAQQAKPRDARTWNIYLSTHG
jgi:hypothetical protein